MSKNIYKAYDLIKSDPILTRYFHLCPLKDLPEIQLDPWQYLIKSIIYQQLSTHVANSIYDKFIALFDNHLSVRLLIDTPDETLRKAGLSERKVSYVKNVASFHEKQPFSKNDLIDMTDKEIIKIYTQIKGVGEWTVQMMLIFYLKRDDVFPIGDLVVRQQLSILFGLDSESKKGREQLMTIMDNYRPYRSIISRLTWDIHNTDKSKY